MKKKRKTGDEELERRLDNFLRSPLALRAGQGLTDGVSVALHVGDEDYFFRRLEGEITLSRVEERKPDVHFWTSDSTLRHMLSLSEVPGTGIPTIGVAIFEHVFSKDLENKIKFRIDSGFLALWAKGYFSVLKAGGPEVASYLARAGFDGLNAIRQVLKGSR